MTATRTAGPSGSAAGRRRPGGGSSGTSRPRSGVRQRSDSARGHIRAWLSRPLTSFHLVVTIAALLTVLGLVMVLSASSVSAYAVDGSAYSMFTRQAIFTAVGVVGFYLAMRIPPTWLRAAARPLVAISILMLVLVLIPGIGTLSQGTRGWFSVGGLSFQPSEFAKVTFAIWGAHVLATLPPNRRDPRQVLVPLLPVAMVIFVLIVLQPDLGQTVAVATILMALLWYGGLSLRLFLTASGGLGLAAIALGLAAGYRSARIQSWLNPSADPEGAGYQSRQALFSLADGGWFGRGLGQSRAKWSYLPNAHNDFIFAIIGEELGVIGCIAVLALFGLLVFAGMRIAMRSIDPFLRLLSATLTVWMVSQVVINVGYVVGLLPVTGLQLPMISAGGTSTAITLGALGLLANAARHEPEAVAALQQGGDGRFGRLLRLPAPTSAVSRVPREMPMPFGMPALPRIEITRGERPVSRAAGSGRVSSPRAGRTTYSDRPRPRQGGTTRRR
ncbi:putative lipid II flippase FtsW [Millisia brevis]|uniref:putative lipid II flippase FtsW n=1 Tax=Millisia brevis TaxID=264148 RepID=UPI00082F0A41